MPRTSQSGKPGKYNPLTDDQKVEIFCQAIMLGATQSDAWRKINPNSKAKPETVWQKASTYAKSEKVQSRMAQLREEHKQRFGICIERLLEELSKMAYFNLQDLFDENGKAVPINKLPREVAAALTKIEFDAAEVVTMVGGEVVNSNEVYIKRVHAVSKEKSVELVGKYLKAWTESVELSGPGGGPIAMTVRRVIVDPSKKQ